MGHAVVKEAKQRCSEEAELEAAGVLHFHVCEQSEMHGEEPEGLIDGSACDSEGLGYVHATPPARKRRDEIVRASDVEQRCDGGDAAVEVADEVGAHIGEGEFGGGEFFGAHLGFEAVDADAVCDLLGFVV